MEYDELYKLIKSRRTIRAFDDKPVPKEVILKLLEAARWAPSAHNRQPWRFVVIYNEEVKKKLAVEMGKKLRADLERDGLPPQFIETKVNTSIARFTKAPVLILACLTMSEMDKYPDERRNNAEKVMAIQSVALALQNILLTAHSLGLGVCWRCAPLFAPEIVKKVLDLPDDWEPQAILEIGYYDFIQLPPERKNLNEIVRWIE
ncbi:MAG: nitroreductase family protein [Candidatus Odinarchaeota archaeon]|nr:nitroreductase family protein [Candidatus Odinarchaeota archaeon]